MPLALRPPAHDRRALLAALAATFAAPHLRAQGGPAWNADRLPALQAQWRSHAPLRAFLMERRGELLSYHRADTPPDTLLPVASVTKSVLSLLVGIAIGRGAIASVDEPLSAFFAGESGADAAMLKRVTLRHLLTMTSGFERLQVEDHADFARRFYAPGLLRHLLARRLVDEPGSRFAYSSSDAHLVALALARRLQVPVGEFAREALFAPLGIEPLDWAADAAGMVNGASDLRLRAADLLRIGQLARAGGRWQDRQLVPSGYLREATRRQVASDLPPRGRPDLWGYGFLWWTASTQGDELPAFYAAGYGGQFIYVVPGLDLVVVAATEQISREVAGRTAALIRDFALPAVAR